MASGDDLASECVPGSEPDAGPDAATDAAPASGCDVSKPFAAAIEVPGIHMAGASDVHATLTDDELTIFFASNRLDTTATKMHLYYATRPTVGSPFGAPTLLPGLISSEGESNPSVSPDGNTIYFDSFRVSQGTIHIFSSTRANATVGFPPATMIAGDYLITPSITADGSVLYAEDLTNAGLVRFDRVGGGFGVPHPVALPPMAFTSPVSRDDLTLFVSLGEMDGGAILVAKRATTSIAFPAPAPVPELANGAPIAEPSWISRDGCRLYLRYQATGDKSRIYVATRPQ